MNKIGQVHTERGLIYVEKYVNSKEEAVKLGYVYSFTSKEANAHCYSRITGENSRAFCLVELKES